MNTLDNKCSVAWNGFVSGDWQAEVNVLDFVQINYAPYYGDSEFLAEPTSETIALLDNVMEGIRQENQTKASVDFDNDNPAKITSHGLGYIAKELEKVVGLQTDKPLKRAILPNGGIRMVEQSCEIYGKELGPEVSEIFTKYCKTHN